MQYIKKFPIGLLLGVLLLSSIFVVIASQMQQPSQQIFAQGLYPTPPPSTPYYCSWNVRCCLGGTQVEYLSCAGGTPCNVNLCESNGNGCSYVAGNDCAVASCHPTYCSPTDGLGGCPGGTGNIDDCGGVSCGSCGGVGGGGGGGGGGPTPTSGEVLAYCGDAACNVNETCSTCAADCGACPTGNVQMRAVSVPSGTSTCAQLDSSTSYIASGITVYPSGISNTTPIDGTYATWSNQTVVPPYTTYGFADTPPGDYVLKIACWTRDAPGASGQGYAADLYGGSTISWQLGYVDGVGWWQADGGDVYASAALRSYVPASASPRYGILDGDSGTPGVVMYGTTYDFSSSVSDTGTAYISSKGWLANETYSPTDYYAVMLHRFGSPAADYTGDTTFTSKLASRPEAYYVDGNLTIGSVDWSVTDGENIVVLVNGNLTINQNINLTGTGFVTFIVNGNITVDPTVGVLYSSSVPVLEGVYITPPTGTFSTGDSSNVGTERFVGRGIFIAGSFTLGRDLDSVGQNNTTAAELFIYNPQLLITMPDEMRDVPVTWQEVAP